jgi:hypothetical protein
MEHIIPPPNFRKITKCSENECEVNKGACCFDCDKLLSCPAPCETGNYETKTCEEAV